MCPLNRGRFKCYLIGGKYRLAEKTYLEARLLLKGDPIWRGRVDRILIDVYMYLGNYQEAGRRARLSLKTFERAGQKADVAKTRVNLANLLHRQDRHREASLEYEAAATFFESSEDTLTLALCRYNHANTLVQLFEMEAAAALYRKAERTFIDLGYNLYANECRYGMSWLQMLNGDYYEALNELIECERSYQAAGEPRGVLLCTLDRAEAYLGLNLFTDARSMAQLAERRARKLGFQYEAAKAALFVAKAAYAVGETLIGRRAIERAESRFRKEDNRAFLGVVLLTKAMMHNRRKAASTVLKSARLKFASAQLPLWQAICDLQLAWYEPTNRSVRDRLRRNKAVRSVPHLYAQWQTLLGDHLARRGRLGAAEKHWLRAAEILDAVRAKLPPLELRTTFLRHRGDPFMRLVRLYAKSQPAKAAAWSERYKTVGVWAPLDSSLEANEKRRRAESSLADLAGRVTALSTHFNGSVGRRGLQMSQSRYAWQKLMDQVRHDLASVEMSVKTEPSRIESIVEDFERVSRRLPVVQFHCDGDDLVAFVLLKGDIVHRRYPDGMRRLRQSLGLWHILLGRALHSEGFPSRRDLADEHRMFRQVGEWLWKPLEIGPRHKRVLILPEGRLTNLPWSAVAQNGDTLGDRHTLILSPSLRHYLHSRRTKTNSKRVSVFVGRLDGLEHTRQELGAFVSRMGEEVQLHDPCLRSDWPRDKSARIWHFTGHAELRTDNPFFSLLQMKDGPLFAADFRLRRNRVGLVTLAACRTGQQMYLPGEEATGLVRSLLEMGARSVIASHWAVADRSTAIWMREFYSHYLEGLPLGESMRQAMVSVREKYPSAYHWAAFSLHGAI